MKTKFNVVRRRKRVSNCFAILKFSFNFSCKVVKNIKAKVLEKHSIILKKLRKLKIRKLLKELIFKILKDFIISEFSLGFLLEIYNYIISYLR